MLKISLLNVSLPPLSQKRRPRNFKRSQIGFLWTVQTGNRRLKQNQGPKQTKNSREIQMGCLEETGKTFKRRSKVEVYLKTYQIGAYMEPEAKVVI
jgi:hypothetical protein